MTEIVAQNVIAEISSETRIRNRLSWNGEITKSKHKVTAFLLDPVAWSGYVLKNAQGTAPYDNSIQAAGAPTVDLWVASWKQMGYTPIYLSTNAADEATNSAIQQVGSGYFASIENPPASSPVSVDVSAMPNTGLNNKVFFPRQESAEGNCSSYLLAAPSAYSSNGNMLRVSVGGKILSNTTYGTKIYGLRPIVSLNTSLIGEDSTSAIYYTGVNINE
ncbi:MAG: hypothetical protein IKP28_05855 [Clostridia bacterium]|nr:hypothetical protein [Clostridia bacterium]